MEKYLVLATLVGAVIALVFAFIMGRRVLSFDEGTPLMSKISRSIREGANAYLAAQFKKIGPLIIVITLVLYVTTQGEVQAFKVGRAGAFLVGALFSWAVGFVGMRLATTGNLRVAAAAR